ncbi:hypothetical protein WN51_09226 [Melipona quadrifasciata]|uniref:Uncharacterized protein n=1 Tax=Melipona quadrifasciata TaxID=166423 RepID=A0A0N0BJN0_9HYME|nr:hypothetical protein WN51_09226 [Melipona quadrifasciata]
MRARSTETFLFLGTRVSQVREKLGEKEPVNVQLSTALEKKRRRVSYSSDTALSNNYEFTFFSCNFLVDGHAVD